MRRQSSTGVRFANSDAGTPWAQQPAPGVGLGELDPAGGHQQPEVNESQKRVGEASSAAASVTLAFCHLALHPVRVNLRAALGGGSVGALVTLAYPGSKT